MKELYIPFSIPNLEEIKQELLDAIDHDYTEPKFPHAFTYSTVYMQSHCPLFMNWLTPKLKVQVRIFRYYVTPPHQELGIHLDGIYPTVPFGLNIPLIGSKNTYHSYYDTEPDNLEHRNPKSYLGGTHPKDLSKLTKICDLEITRPYVINNEVLHGVRNESDVHRVMFTIRWPIHKTLFRDIHDVMNVDELRLNQN